MSVRASSRGRLGSLLLALCLPVQVAASDPGMDDWELDLDTGLLDPAADGEAGSLDQADTSNKPLPGLDARISYQVYGQLREHSTRLASGESLNKSARSETHRLNLTLGYQRLLGEGLLLRASGRAKLYLPGDYRRFNTIGKTVKRELDLDELYLQHSGERDTFTLGNQTIVWGEALGNSVLDVLNTAEYRDFSVIEIEDARLNQFMLRWDHHATRYRTQFFFNPTPRYNPLPVPGNPVTPTVDIATDEPGHDGPEIGLQLAWSIPNSDFALMAAWLTENDVRYALPVDASQPAHGVSNRYWLLGASANRAFGDFLARLDLAWSQQVFADIETDAADPTGLQAVHQDRAGVSLGFEYRVSHTQSLSLSVSLNQTLDGSRGLAPDQRLRDSQPFGSWLLRHHWSLDHGNLRLATTLNGSAGGDALLASLLGEYQLDDHWSLTAHLIHTRASETSPSRLLDGDIRQGLTLGYAY